MNDLMDTSPLKRIADLINFQQQIKNNLQKTYEEIRDVAKQLEKIENVNQTLRDENYELNSTNETQNTTIQIFQQKILVREDQLKKRPFTLFTVQRSPKFPDPEKFGGGGAAMSSNLSNSIFGQNSKPMAIGIPTKTGSSITLFHV